MGIVVPVWANVLVCGVVVLWLGVVAYGDVRTRRVPLPVVVMGCGVAAGYAMVHGREKEAVLGGLALSGIYLVTRLVGHSIGGGDVKVALPLGALAGVAGGTLWMVAALGAMALTAVLGLVGQWQESRHPLSEAAQLFLSPHSLPHAMSMSVWTGVVVAVFGMSSAL